MAKSESSIQNKNQAPIRSGPGIGATYFKEMDNNVGFRLGSRGLNNGELEKTIANLIDQGVRAGLMKSLKGKYWFAKNQKAKKRKQTGGASAPKTRTTTGAKTKAMKAKGRKKAASSGAKRGGNKVAKRKAKKEPKKEAKKDAKKGVPPETKPPSA